jgi:hypothetical protein
MRVVPVMTSVTQIVVGIFHVRQAKGERAMKFVIEIYRFVLAMPALPVLELGGCSNICAAQTHNQKLMIPDAQEVACEIIGYEC